MNARLLFVAVVVSALTISPAGYARDRQTLVKNLPADKEVKTVSVEANLDVARLSLVGHPGGDMFTATVDYDADRTKVDVEYEKAGTSGELYLSSEKIKRNLDLDTDDNKWEVSLSRDYVWNLDLDLSVTDTRINLSGLPVENLELDMGASECRVTFDEPNPRHMRRLVVKAGAADLDMIGLGHADFRDFYFDGGAGDVALNFAGLKEGPHSARIHVGVGSVRIELPAGIPVRIESDDGWLNEIAFPDGDFEEIDEGVYETPGFDEAKSGLELEIDVGIGEATVEWID